MVNENTRKQIISGLWKISSCLSKLHSDIEFESEFAKISEACYSN